MAKKTEQLGVPPGLQLYSCFPFSGLNLSPSRTAIKDQEFYDIENFVKVGDGNLRTLWDVGDALWVTSGGLNIINIFFYNIADTQYVAIFLNDRTAVQVNIETGADANISTAPGTFADGSNPGHPPGCIQWGSQYLLIGNNHVESAYWVWDGALLYGPGTLTPIVEMTSGGSNYTSQPTIVAYGGSGTGTQFQAVLGFGGINSINVTNPGSGYQIGDLVQLAFTGGGSDSSAILVPVIGGSGGIAAINVTTAGTGYTSAPTVTFSGGGGHGATAVANISGGAVTSVTITNTGVGYTSAPTIGFTGGSGSGAAATAILAQSGVSSVTIFTGGSGYTSPPLISFEGGGGSGASATAQITGGVVTAITMTANGDGYTSTPAVVASGGNNAASATVSLMPYGVSGTCLEDYVSRVWIGDTYTPPSNPPSQNNGNKFQVSAPQSLSDFATSDGGLLFTSQDRFLRQQYVAMRQTNGYLYPIGDSSVSIISGVNTSGDPPTTTFSYQNTDPQIGTPWRDSCQDFGRTVLFSNPLGAYGVYGGAVNKISDQLDPIFSNTYPPNGTGGFTPIAGAITPTSAAANIFGKKYFLQLMTIVDPITLQTENKMIVWDSQNWFLASQSVELIIIATQEVNSNLTAWGTDGTAVYPLFQTPSATLPKRLSTKLYGVSQPFMSKQVFGVVMQGQNQATAGGEVDLTISVDTDAGTYTMGETSFSLSSAYPTGYPLVNSGLSDVSGLFLGLTLSTTDADVTLNYLGIAYQLVSYELSSFGLQLDNDPIET